MDYGALTAARLRSGQWLHWGIRFFLAAALTASETVDGYAPFALGCIAAAGPGAGGAAALGGGVMGALLFLPFQQALAFAAVGILTVTAATAFRDTDFFKRPWVMPVLAAGIPTLMQSEEGRDLVVTPRELDSVIAHGAALLAAAINRALQPRLSIAQLGWLTN